MRKVLYILGKLTDADIDWLVSSGFRRDLPAGTPVTVERKTVDSIFLVLDGHLHVTSSSAPGLILANLGVGEIVGEISLLDDRPASATVTAADDAMVLAISKAALQKKLASDEGFAARFYKALGVFLADRLRTTVKRLGPKTEDQMRESTDELSLELLDETSLAGSRFELLLERLRSG